MPITARAVPILSDNYAWLLHDEGSGAVAIVDPADAKACIAAIEQDGGKLDLIIITHHHDDHIAGVDEVRARYGAKVVGATADKHRLPHLDQEVAEGDRVAFGQSSFEVIDTPGHTRGHISYFLARRRRPTLRRHAVQPRAAAGCSRGRPRRCSRACRSWPSCPTTRWSAAAMNTPRATPASP